jgi:hypothetical protein
MKVSKAEGGELGPFNQNDVLVFTARICQYICKNGNFQKRKFLEVVANDELGQFGAYLKRNEALENDQHPLHNLIHYCLRYLLTEGLIKKADNGLHNFEYGYTQTLKLLCPIIEKYELPSIQSLVDEIIQIERKIKTDNQYFIIINILKGIEHQNIDISKINDIIIHKLIQYGLIDVFLNKHITLTYLGKILTERSNLTMM